MQAKTKRRVSEARHRAPARSAKAAAGSASADLTPDREEVVRLAHSYWEARGYQGGSAEEDWFRAERELRAIQANEG
jgi:hypothetical protein